VVSLFVCVTYVAFAFCENSALHLVGGHGSVHVMSLVACSKISFTFKRKRHWEWETE